jgi:WD40 repeat protein
VRTGVFPSYSPNGDRLVSNDQPAAILHNSILLMNADGSGPSVLFSDPKRSALAPCTRRRGIGSRSRLGASSRGSRAVDRRHRRDACRWTGVQILTDGSGNNALPSWSPDGRQLVYRAAAVERSGLSIIDVETRAVRVLTSDSEHDNFPSWSPKGNRIAFTSNRDGDYEIYTIRPDGSDLRRLTNTPGKRCSQFVVARRRVDRLHQCARWFQGRGGPPPIQSAAIWGSVHHARRRIGRPDGDRRSV